MFVGEFIWENIKSNTYIQILIQMVIGTTMWNMPDQYAYT